MVFCLIVLIVKIDKEWKTFENVPIDKKGSVVYSIGILLFVYGFTTLNEMSGVILTIVGIIFLIAFAYLELKIKNPVFEVRFFKNPKFSSSNFAALSGYLATFAIVMIVNYHLQYIRGFSSQTSGLLLMITPVFQVVLAPLAGRLSDKVNPQKLSAIGIAIGAVAIGIIATLNEHTPSGSDKDAGRKVRQILDANGWKLRAIYNTHSNADHIGGNKYLQGQTGCRIYAPGIECDFTNHPILEPAFLYGGYPCKDLRHKFLLAQESKAEPLTGEVLPEGFELIPLPGHFFDMAGFRTPDDVVYLADCLSARETLDKYQIGFIYDVASYLETLEKVKTMKAKLFIPSHAAPEEDISDLAQYNIDKVREIAGRIRQKF